MKPVQNILEINQLSVRYVTNKCATFALRDFSLSVPKNRIIGIAGESGSGKSTLAKAILRLLPQNSMSGRISLNDGDEAIDITALNMAELRNIRGNKISLVFQEPASAFNPVYRIGQQILEAIAIHKPQFAGRNAVLESLQTVGLSDSERIFKSYPHEVSGGQLQRAAIAMAIINQPKVLIADEITTALDNLTQKEIINLILRLKKDMGLSVVLISHDLALLGEVSDQIAVLKNGELVEKNDTVTILNNPDSEYTKKLIRESFFEDRISQTEPAREIILKVDNLKISYESDKGFFRAKSTVLEAVKGISFDVKKGESLGLIGESGSGKSSIASAILSLIGQSDGDIFFKDIRLSRSDKKEIRRLRKYIQVVFQNPDASLDPRIHIGAAIKESLCQFNKDQATKEKVISLLEMVRLNKDYYDRLPNELSGGEKQRVCIARALSYEPELLICDEPLSSLDAPIKKEILTLLGELKSKLGLSLLFISHDLAVVSHICERIIVLKDGQIVEEGSATEICTAAKKDYTKSLLKSSIRLKKRI